MAWVLGVARKALLAMADLTGVPYGLPKLDFLFLDQVHIPSSLPPLQPLPLSQYPAGGLENHGLVSLVNELFQPPRAPGKGKFAFAAAAAAVVPDEQAIKVPGRLRESW